MFNINAIYFLFERNEINETGMTLRKFLHCGRVASFVKSEVEQVRLVILSFEIMFIV